MNKTLFMVFSGTNSDTLQRRSHQVWIVILGGTRSPNFLTVNLQFSLRRVYSWSRQYSWFKVLFPILDNLMELLLMIDAAKRASAKSIIALSLHFRMGAPGQKRQNLELVSVLNYTDVGWAGRYRPSYHDGLVHADQIQDFWCSPDHL